jgi:hypothetical protein
MEIYPFLYYLWIAAPLTLMEAFADDSSTKPPFCAGLAEDKIYE